MCGTYLSAISADAILALLLGKMPLGEEVEVVEEDAADAPPSLRAFLVGCDSAGRSRPSFGLSRSFAAWSAALLIEFAAFVVTVADVYGR